MNAHQEQIQPFLGRVSIMENLKQTEAMRGAWVSPPENFANLVILVRRGDHLIL